MNKILIFLLLVGCGSAEQEWREQYPEQIIEAPEMPDINWDQPEPTPPPKKRLVKLRERSHTKGKRIRQRRITTKDGK